MPTNGRMHAEYRLINFPTVNNLCKIVLLLMLITVLKDYARKTHRLFTVTKTIIFSPAKGIVAWQGLYSVTMKKIAVIFIAFSVTLYGCIFDIGFDKDQHRIYVPVLVSNLKDTLNIGDTLVFSAAISNPVEVTDISRERKKTFEGTLFGSLGFVILLYRFSENNTGVRDIVPFQDRPSTFNFIAEKGFFPKIPPSIDFDFDSGKFSFKFKAVPLKKGLYALQLIKEFTTITNNNNKLEGHIYPYFTNKELNHKLTANHKDALPFNDKWVLFYVR